MDQSKLSGLPVGCKNTILVRASRKILPMQLCTRPNRGGSFSIGSVLLKIVKFIKCDKFVKMIYKNYIITAKFFDKNDCQIIAISKEEDKAFRFNQ